MNQYLSKIDSLLETHAPLQHNTIIQYIYIYIYIYILFYDIQAPGRSTYYIIILKYLQGSSHTGEQ